MSLGIIGTKIGMTRLFRDSGESVPVTLVAVDSNRVVRIKNGESDGYSAVQLSYGTRQAKRMRRPLAGELKKIGLETARGLKEFRVDADTELPEVGAEVGADLFEAGQKVNVSGTSIGKGFAGTIKRHNFHGQDNSHGNSLSHRVMGATGQCQFPGRVFKGKKMPGRMGGKQVTQRNLEVVQVSSEEQLLWIRGAVPGATGGRVVVRPAR
ncbi:MAG: 50S ribosomal protein L3 [Gammaproteobacteria bacterium]|nr:50S ribosomal protein L3 [Gammaproteobacteria bacterium]